MKEKKNFINKIIDFSLQIDKISSPKRSDHKNIFGKKKGVQK